jgi:hypothetical protein
MKRARIEDAAALAFAAIAIALVFPGLVRAREFLWGDFVSWYYPAHDYAAERWREGGFPLWNPYTDGGMPFAGEADHASFYPPSLLLHQLTASRWGLFYGLEAFALAHMGLAIAGTYALLRGLGCGAPASLFAGLAYGLGSVFVARAAQVSLVCAQAWAPLVLAAARSAVSGARPALAVAGGGVALGLLALAGSPATLAVTGVGVGVVVAAEALVAPGRLGPRLGRGLLAILGVSGIGLALGAVQLLPILELLRESERAAYTLADLAEYTVSPASLVMLVVPRFYGWLLYDRASYWGPSNFVELSGYAGLLPLLLAPLALGRRRRQALPFLALAVVGLLLALGPYGGLQRLFYELVPVIGELRTPARYLQLWALGVAVLAGLGLDAVLRGEGPRPHNYLTAALVLALGLVGGLLLLAPALATWLEAWKQPFFDEAMRLSLVSVAAAAVALALLIARPRTRAAALVPVAALLADLALQGAGIGVTGERELVEALWEDPGAVVETIARDPELGRVRDRYAGPAPLMLIRAQADSGPGRHVLRYERFQQRIFSLHSRLLDLLNVRYVVQARSDDLSETGPNLVAPEALWMHRGESHGLVVDPPLRAGGLVLVSTTNSMDRAPGDTVATLDLTGADGRQVRLPVRLGVETGDFVANLGGTLVDVEHFVDVADAGARLRRHYVARLDFEALDLARVQVTHVGGASAWVLKELYPVSGSESPGRFTTVASARRSERFLTYLYRNDDAMPRAFLAPAYRLVDGPDAALDVVSGDGFDPRAEVVIERERSTAPDPPVASLGKGTALLESYAPEQVVVSALAPAPGAWLVLTDIDFPGWTAEVDGAPAPIARADALFRAVWLGAGPHRVVFRYAPRSVAVGSRLTLAGGLAAAALALVAWRAGASAATTA